MSYAAVSPNGTRTYVFEGIEPKKFGCTASDVMDTVAHYLGLKTDADLARLLGISSAAVCQARKRSNSGLRPASHLRILSAIEYMGCSDFEAALDVETLLSQLNERSPDVAMEWNLSWKDYADSRIIWHIARLKRIRKIATLAEFLDADPSSLWEIRHGGRRLSVFSRASVWCYLNGKSYQDLRKVMREPLALTVAVEERGKLGGR